MLQIKKIGGGCYHVSLENGKASMFTRYGILNETLSKEYADCTAEIQENVLLLHGVKRDLSVLVEQFGEKGFQLTLPLEKGERLFGLGDANRDSVMLRGKTLNVWVANVASYGPMPVLLSSDGWAIVVNSTYYQKFDIADSDKDKVVIS
ncbi:MAG: hypothetical protein J6K86_00405, partial [Clostridia bacterium]|nr:hypothetical protein [Clostridia bacterium]